MPPSTEPGPQHPASAPGPSLAAGGRPAAGLGPTQAGSGEPTPSPRDAAAPAAPSHGAAPPHAGPPAPAAAAADVDSLLRAYHGLRFRGDGSGYKLPWDVRLRMPQRPGEKRANVDIARVKSAEEGAVAFDIGTAWRQLHPTAGGGAPHPDEYNFPVIKYRQDTQLWSRIRAARSLPQLRTLLTSMRESRQLEALAARLVQEQRATPPEVLAAQRAEATALVASMRGGRGALEAAAVRQQQQAGGGAKRSAQPLPRGRPPKRGGGGEAGQHGLAGEALEAGAPLESLRRHLEVVVSELQQGGGHGASPQPRLPAGFQPLPPGPAAQPPQQQQQLQDTPPGSAVAALAALLRGASPAAGALSGTPDAAPSLQQLLPGGALLAQQHSSLADPLSMLGRVLSSLGASPPAGSPSSAWQDLRTSTAPAAAAAPQLAPWGTPPQLAAGGWGAAAPQLPAAQHSHDGLLQRLLAAAQAQGGAAAGLSSHPAAGHLLGLQHAPVQQQQQQQASLMDLLLQADHYGGAATLSAGSATALSLLGSRF